MEAATWRYSIKKPFYKFSQSSEENTMQDPFFMEQKFSCTIPPGDYFCDYSKQTKHYKHFVLHRQSWQTNNFL